MICERRWSDAGPAGRVNVGKYEYKAESPKQGSNRFNFIMKTIHFAHLCILYYLSIPCTSPSYLPCNSQLCLDEEITYNRYNCARVQLCKALQSFDKFSLSPLIAY